MQFQLNGVLKDFDGDPELSLLTWLREQEGIISPKDGCSPQAACGCCAVELSGKAVLSCVTPMKKVAGASVVTTEGLGEFRQQVYSHAFVATGGIQCGFCIPGIVMQANSLINRNAEPSRDEIEKALTPHLCRCTGYKKIVDAIEYAAEAIRNEEEIPEPSSPGRVGDRHPKYDSFAAVLGQRPYVDDLHFDGLLHGALRFSDHPRARVLRIDTAQAQQMAGVVRIFTAADVPGQRSVGLIKQDWPLFVAQGEETRYVGDALALVVADRQQAARAAAAQIVDVEYEVLEPLTDPFEARSSPARRRSTRSTATSCRTPSPARRRARSARGHRLHRHRPLRDAAHRARLHGDRGRRGAGRPGWLCTSPLYSQGQGVSTRIASRSPRCWASDEDAGAGDPGAQRRRLRRQGGHVGAGPAALAAHLLGRPVKVRLTRDESIRMHPKRHPIWMDYEVGCDAAGR
jgi:aldehyde oxidoreductase